jgi:hypothetical protein
MSDPTQAVQPHSDAYVTPFIALLPPNARLLVQAGATDGALARQYRATYPASSFVVVDADLTLAQQAREYADRVHQANLDTASDAFYKHLEWADGWIFDATLENMADPARVLAQVRKVIQCDACVVARIANADYWLKAQAQPQPLPEMAPRHALTAAAALGLFEGAGFRVVNGLLLNPGPLPADVEAALRLQASQSGIAPEPLLEAAQPSHYLFKAMPAR